MIFVTVGTSFPFDRLIRAMDELADRGEFEEEIFAQVGKNGYRPRHFKSVETLDKQQFDIYFDKAEALIAHAGMGTITMALNQHKPILIMPRLRRLKELVNDHQLATAKHFEQLGHVLTVYDVKNLPHKYQMLKSFQPTPRKSQAEQVASRIGNFLTQLL